MRRLVLCGLSLVAGGCSAGGSCSLTYLQSVAGDVGAYIAPKIPLDVKADCSGASRVPFNDQAETGAGASAGDCTPDDTDSPCMACLRGACCTVVGESCAGASAAACAAMDSVKGCIVGALTNPCATQCSGAQ